MEINWITELFDSIASLSGWAGRWLNANKKRSCFIMFSLATGYWIFRNFYLGLYSQTAFCCLNIALNIYGYIKWNQK